MQFYDVAQQSLAKSGSSIVEEYIPLWFADGTYEGEAYTSAGVYFLQDGSSTPVNGSKPILFSLNSNWAITQQYALEATIYNATPSDTAYVALYDVTSGIVITSSQVSVTSTTATVARSGKFTLTPGHSYGITLWDNAGEAYVVDASLVVFGQ